MLSGLASERHPLHVRRIGRELRRYGGELNEVDVPCYRLADVLADHNIEHVDYLSIDVEGAEYSILNSLDFGRLSITVIGVENNYQDPRLPELLSSAGYEFHSIVGDEFYLKTNRCLCS